MLKLLCQGVPLDSYVLQTNERTNSRSLKQRNTLLKIRCRGVELEIRSWFGT